MRTLLCLLCFLLAGALPLPAQEAAFSPPQPYPVTRYEAGWLKNPFTLKTAPQAIMKESSFKDLSLGGVTKTGSKFSIVVVNSKTRERTQVTNVGPKTDGKMYVKSLSISPDRKETTAEVELGTEVATLKFDEKVLNQMAHNGQPGMPGLPGQAHPSAPRLPQVPQPPRDLPRNRTVGNQPSNFPPGLAQANAAQQQMLNNMPIANRRRILTQPNPVHN